MPPPPIQLFLTTIVMNPQIRQRQEFILRVLQVKKVPYISYDLASDEDAKKLWRRKAPRDKQQLPGLLIGGEFPGDFQAFEEAVEFEELDLFLRLKENWEPLEDDRPLLRAVPVGVPGAYSPAQMNPEHVSPAPSPIKTKPPVSREGEIDAGDSLGDSSLAGVGVTEDDLLKLVEELGLGGADADDLVKGLTGEDTSAPAKEEPPAAEKPPVSAPADVKEADEPKVEAPKADAEPETKAEPEVTEETKTKADAETADTATEKGDTAVGATADEKTNAEAKPETAASEKPETTAAAGEAKDA